MNEPEAVPEVIEHYDGRVLDADDPDLDYYTAIDPSNDMLVVVTVEDDYVDVTPAGQWLYDPWTWNGGLGDWLGYDIEEEYNDNFWEFTPTIYHATNPGSAALIVTGGELQARNQTRGLGNRGVGPAVFTSKEMAHDIYGEAVFAIDTEAMQADGLEPFVRQEPDVAEERARMAVASEIGLDDFFMDIPPDIDQRTVIIHDDIPLEYLSLDAESEIVHEIEGHIARLHDEDKITTEESDEALAWLGIEPLAPDGGSVEAGVEQATLRELVAGIDDPDVKANAFPVVEALLDWGATDVSVIETGRGASVDFHTPMPGEQPIRSGVLVTDEGVERATLRYGVLERNRHVLERSIMRDIVTAVRRADVNPPGGLPYITNLGDLDQYPPRPHILVGWRPSEAAEDGRTFDTSRINESWRPHDVYFAYEGTPTVIFAHHDDQKGAVDAYDFADFVVAAGEELRERLYQWDE